MSAGWTRKGYQSKTAYDAACRKAQAIKTAALDASRAKYTARNLLQWACYGKYNNYDNCNVTFTKAQAQEALGGLDRKAVLFALQFLRAEGTLIPIRNWQGGRSIPTTYRIVAKAPAQAKPEPEPEQHQERPETADPVVARMRVILDDKPGIGPMRAYEIAKLEIEGGEHE